MRLSSLLLCVLLAACAGGAESSGADDRWVELRDARFFVEIADDDASRVRGLMFRDSLPADRGMLFIHDVEEPQAFWMKNTRIPLDILYFDSQRRLVSLARRTPPCSAGDRCPSYPSGKAARYTLELNAGTADRLGVQLGDELKFGPGVAVD